MKLTESVYLVGGAAYGLSPSGDCNVYLIDGGKELALVDTGSGHGVKKILENVRIDGFDPSKLKIAFLTHCHFDHIGGAYELKHITKCKLLAHENDAQSIVDLDGNVLLDIAKEQGLSIKAPQLDSVIREGDCINVGNLIVKVLHTPGHTPVAYPYVS